MSVKVSRRITSIFLTLAMIVSCFAFSAFAASSLSSAQGTTQSNHTVAKYSKGTLKVSGAKKVSAKRNGKKAKVSGSTIKGLKKGDLVDIKTEDGTSYRWFQKVSVKSRKNGTSTKKGVIKWKKLSKASKYVVEYELNGKKEYKTVSKSKNSYKLPKNAKNPMVRAIRKANGHVYSGIRS